MASSRWKRFAFFEKNALSIPSEVFNDLIPFGVEGKTLRDASSQAEESEVWGGVSMVVSTASLPLRSKPRDVRKDYVSEEIPMEVESDALSKMWSTLNACSMPETFVESAQVDSTTPQAPVVTLPSQSQSLNERDIGKSTSEEALDGLVLVFSASKFSSLVHCFDVTVRCHPQEGNESLEDLDGWRGYFAPLSQSQALSSRDSSSTLDLSSDGIIALAACRSSEGHRPLHLACISKKHVCIWEDPHLFLSCRLPLTSPRTTEGPKFTQSWNSTKDGIPSAVDLVPGIMAIGTETGAVLVFVYRAIGNRSTGKISLYLRIPPPPAPGMSVVSVKISLGQPDHNEHKTSVFVAYRRSQESQSVSAAGICCYDVPTPGPNSGTMSAPSARHDLDGRHVAASGLCDAMATAEGYYFTVARTDGLYTYSQTQKIGVAPIDGAKLSICVIPPPMHASGTRDMTSCGTRSAYTLVASTDTKSDRDAVDIYDPTNKLVAFHLLLSPGHRAVRTAGVTTAVARSADGRLRGGRSSALVMTSGGSLISFTEKVTEEKVSLLVQKNLFSAAVAIAYSDPSLEPSSITTLYRKYAEYLYRKGDYTGSIEQYINTIGSLHPSYVIFRFLGAPTIHLLAKYLEELRARDLATPVHCDLLRTCYLKLNDSAAAESCTTSTSATMDKNYLRTLLYSLSTSPKEALATICSLEAPQAAEILVAHGATLAQAMPRETAGIVISLCVGTYSPTALAKAATAVVEEANRMLEQALDDREKTCEPFPIQLFYSAFLDNPKMLRLILAHCNRNKCHLTPALRRTLLELTLDEWNNAKRSGDTEGENLRHREAIAALTDSHCHEIGDYDALVIVQKAGFDEGELLLYERLQMGSMLLSRYAHDGSEKSRRQMLAMSQADPEILADVLGHFVSIGSERLYEAKSNADDDDDSEDGASQILDDIHEALDMARLQGKITPVRIARILAGEGTEQFSAGLSTGARKSPGQQTVPLSVALEYVGAILDESRKEIARLKSEVQEYNQLCNSMEAEVSSLMRASLHATSPEALPSDQSRMNIDEVYSKVKTSMDDPESKLGRAEHSREAFWRELNQSEESFETIARFFAKGVIH